MGNQHGLGRGFVQGVLDMIPKGQYYSPYPRISPLGPVEENFSG